MEKTLDELVDIGELPNVHMIEDLKNNYNVAYEARNRLTKECMSILSVSKRHEYWKDIKELTEYFEDIHRQLKDLLDNKPSCLERPI